MVNLKEIMKVTINDGNTQLKEQAVYSVGGTENWDRYCERQYRDFSW